MKYEVVKKRNITNEDLLNDLISVSRKLKSTKVTINEYNKIGKYNSSSLIRRFGSWTKCLALANLEISKFDYSKISRQDYLNDINAVAKNLNKNSLSAKEYDLNGKYSSRKIIRIFETWNNALKGANLFYKISKNLTEEELFSNLLNVWQKLGRQPYYSDMHQPLSICSAKPYVSKYGSWYAALETFVEYVNKNETVEIANEDLMTEEKTINSFPKHKTPRNINLRLRYKVLQRDNFKCVICGRSPAKDPNVELHIDHIIPWSKGGETVIENLRTTCFDCNIGKSDLL